jgi:hypothetical protein
MKEKYERTKKSFFCIFLPQFFPFLSLPTFFDSIHFLEDHFISTWVYISHFSFAMSSQEYEMHVKLTETKLQAEYAAPIIAAELPKIFRCVFVDTKYVKTTTKVKTISTPNRSHADTVDECEIAA